MYENKNVLIFGFGVTGKSALKCMDELNANIYVYDANGNYNDDFNIDFKIFKNEDLDKIDFIIKSPGINPDNEILNLARDKNIKIVSDIEIAYEITKCKNLIAITGTNGKTTTTTLVTNILSSVNKTYCVGNIGVGILDIALSAEENDYIVIEASSFQLADTINFRPRISAITNVTSDHLDWHGNVENYREAKCNVFKNQKDNDITILNYNSAFLRDLKLNKNVLYFSTEDINRSGAYLDNDKIYFRDLDNKEEFIINLADIRIPGMHNVENVLAAISIAKSLKIDSDIIKESIMNFLGVENRIEFVRELNKVKYYNDSKGTNPDSTIMAIKAMDDNLILIAGGYDKKADYSKMLEVGKEKIKHLILLGETAENIEKEAKPLGYDIYIVKDLNRAVDLSYNLAKKEDTVLLSPACASWDMYPSYEVRGEHFRKLVNSLGE
ncbi:UDP-N-acetylmuramoyl-L-alanine--D-glutamate ligase [Peptoniphilus stercorisuis]|uniref:UDP-N-acetylmuramoylalanine--D-glutamate ligase n=1 Tax=Peptoniphilus stercorisuis TaxID=1436965 RepID=A0ABS4KDI1_9FIRM|nr:UDP-N-acetylmuramoyl-L-alanine--D-glutamate ligase [Peptoniphilus stercorisuis]MBP2025829.1 UDP-N-acetylmuramoylalanine--D-glutamate ligase [Peptoniphilus stercorisuis]